MAYSFSSEEKALENPINILESKMVINKNKQIDFYFKSEENNIKKQGAKYVKH